ncbi:MAG: RNA-binding domain-containing protein, partial [Chloroflexota bacterium]
MTYLDILRKAEAEGLDMIAFTDHNSVAGYARMRQEIADLERWEASGRLSSEEKQRLEEYRRLTDKILVLPGMELTATFGFHILAIFDEDTPVRNLEHVLLSLNVPLDALDQGDTEVGATTDVLTAYRVMAEAGALVIAAHANSSHGVAMFGLDFAGQTRIAYTQDPHLHALEVTDLENQRRRSTASFFNGSRPQYPRRMHCIQGSDAHRIVGKGKDLGVGERATEVLLTEVSFRALKELFVDQDFARTRPYRRTEQPFDHVEAARQEGASIVQSFHDSMARQGGRLHAVIRDVAAFANTNGGTIYVGVSPSARVAVKGIEEPVAAMAELKTEIEHLITPPIAVEMSTVNTQGKDVLRVVVPRGPAIPYVIEGSKIYLRQEAETSLAVREEIVNLVRRAVLGPAPATPAAQATPAQQPGPTQPAARPAQG